MSVKTSELPKLNLPGDKKFVGYQSSLHHYCHKKGLLAPQFTVEKGGDGLIGIVSFSGHYIKCEEISCSKKEANARAAYKALKELGYLRGQEFQIPSQLLNQKVVGNAKDQLYILCQRRKLQNPTYSAVYTSAGVVSTVIIEDKKYTGVSKLRKDAEHKAAQTAVDALGYLGPVSTKSVQDVDSVINAKTQNMDTMTNPTYMTDAVPGGCVSSVTNDVTITGKMSLPKIYLPGEGSLHCDTYKSALLQYTNKKKLLTPQYSTERLGFDLIGSVHFSGCSIKCEETSPTVRVAEERAAYEALKQAGYLQGQPFQIPSYLLLRKFGGTHKMTLNEICVSKKLPPPTYNTVPSRGGLVCTVTIEDKHYTGTACKKEKDAEQRAAQRAVVALGYGVPKGEQVAVNAKTHLNHITRTYMRGLPSPSYNTFSVPGGYLSTVTFNGEQYEATSVCATPKEAEQSAAEAALASGRIKVPRKGQKRKKTEWKAKIKQRNENM